MEKIALVNFKKTNFQEHGSTYGTTNYSYFTDLENLKKGDILVVETVYGESIARFVKYSDSVTDYDHAEEWIIEKVDLDSYNLRKEKAMKREKLIQEMRKLRDTQMEIQMFKELAKANPTMESLLKDYEGLLN